MVLELPISVFNEMLVGAIKIIPNIIASRILLFDGWLLGRVIGDAIKRVLQKIRTEE